MALKPKHRRFVDEYLVDLNATKAAVRAGYSERSAGAQGHRLINLTEIADAIRKAQRERAERTGIRADRVLEELARIAFANMSDYMRTTDEGDAFVDLSKLTREQASAISEVIVEDFRDGRGANARDVRRVKFKLIDKRQALSDLGKHLGLFTDRRGTPGEAGILDDSEATPASERLRALIEAIETGAEETSVKQTSGAPETRNKAGGRS